LTGAATEIGPINFNAVGAIDCDPATGILYGIGTDEGGASVLIKISPATGEGTLVGPTLIEGLVSDMSFRNADGQLFAHDGTHNQLYTVDKATGAATLVGATRRALSDGNSLAFSLTDTLYQTDLVNVSTLDQASGAATVLEPISFPTGAGSRFAAMDFNPDDGVAYGIVLDPLNGASLGFLDVVSGAAGIIGPTTPGMDALAFLCCPMTPTPIPSPTPFDDAIYISDSLPAKIPIGAAFGFGVIMKNTGNTTWTTENGHLLGLVSDPCVVLPTNRFPVREGDAVAPNETYQFLLYLTAPQSPGACSITMRMYQEGGAGLFGDLVSINLNVVGPPPNMARDWEAFE